MDTYIYWLVDTRPGGGPFYCGKTTIAPEERLDAHRRDAKKVPHRRVSRAVLSCGEHMALSVVAVVPAGVDWAPIKRNWTGLAGTPRRAPAQDRRKHAENRRKRLDAIALHNEEKRRYMASRGLPDCNIS